MLYISYIPQIYENLIVSAQTTLNITIPDVFTIECTDSKLFTTILDALGNKKKITFPLGTKELTIEDLSITEQSYFGNGHYLSQLRSIASKHFSKIPMYTYFRFQYLNNIFASRGIFITATDRDKKYIEIIEKDDPELMKYLEEYLQVLNQLKEQERIYQGFVNAQERMQYEQNEEALRLILEEAQEVFTSAQRQFVTTDNRGYFSTADGKYLESMNVPTQSENTDSNPIGLKSENTENTTKVENSEITENTETKGN